MPAPFNQSPEELAAVERVRGAKDQAERGIHKDFRERSEHYYRLYRSYQATRSAWIQAGGSDRDGLVLDARRQWGAELFIPYAFGIVEVIVPRAVSQRPRMLILPRSEGSENNVENVRLMIDAQQEQIDYELTLQDVLRTGMIYGLGVQKVLWRREYAQRRQVKRATLPQKVMGAGAYVQGPLETVCTFNDPDAEWVDPFDFFWDPYGHSIRTCDWVIHRTWRSLAYVLERLRDYGGRADWNTAAAQALTEEDARSMGSTQGYSEIWSERMLAAGHRNFDVQGEQLHEVWEFHDGRQVLTVLDGQVLVRQSENPTLGQIPFQIYRPTRVPGEFVGIGEIEPIEHLQLELNARRSQRLDVATLKLMAPYIYDTGVIDADDLVWGPGTAIGVNGPPRESIWQLQVGDIPNSSFEETSEIVGDIQRTTGVDDTVAGADGGGTGAASTATGVQLVQAAANKRIENKARRMEVEVIRPAARLFLALDQRMIIEEREVRVPVEPPPAEPDEKRWEWYELGPEELRGEFDVVPEGGSTQPENTPQKRQDAQMKWNMLGGNPMVDQRQLLRDVLDDLGVKHPDTWISPPDRLPPAVLQKLADLGVPADWIQLAVEQAQSEDQTAGQEQPAPEQQPTVAA